MSADQTCCISLISRLRFSIPKVMDRFAFDKVQVKGVVLKLPESCSPELECEAQGVLKSGRSQSNAVGGPVLCKYSVLLCIQRWNIPEEFWSPRKGGTWCNKRCVGTGWCLGPKWLYFSQHTVVFSLPFNDLTPSLTTHSRSSSGGKSQQANDGNGLCSEWNLWALTDKTV